MTHLKMHYRPTLAEAGISKGLAHEARKEFAKPEAQFEAEVIDIKSGTIRRPTATGG